jgi:hypothetical protein
MARGVRELGATIIHISGHEDPSFSYFDDSNAIDLKGLADLFALGRERGGNGLQGAVMNAGFTSSHSQGIADAVGQVVAMEGILTDEGATEEFYGALGYVGIFSQHTED